MPSPAVERVRKLLRRAQSSNKYEAALAEERARELMKKHGLTDHDVEEIEVEASNAARGPFRDELARIVGRAYRCAIVVNKRGRLGFRGLRSDAAEARNAHDRICTTVDQSSEIPPHELGGGRELWNICWWLGMLAVLEERFGTAERGQVSAQDARGIPLVTEALQAQEAFTDELSMRWNDEDVDDVIDRFRERAYGAGRAWGLAVDLGRINAGLLKGV